MSTVPPLFRFHRFVRLFLPLATLALSAQAGDDLFADLGEFAPLPPAAHAPVPPPAPGAPMPAHTTTPSDLSDPADPSDLTDPSPSPPPPAPPPPQPESTPPSAPTPHPDSSPPPAPPPKRISAAPSPPPPPIDPLRAGGEYLRRGDLDRAQSLFESVLQNDPYNLSAMKQLRHTAAQRARREKRSAISTRERLMADVQAAWNTPRARTSHPDDDPSPSVPPDEERKSDLLRAKLKSLLIAELHFNQTPVQQAILHLSALCRDLDPDKTGVNLVVYGSGTEALPPVTFSGTHLSALEALEIITRMTGMKFDIEPRLVTLTPMHYESPQQMITAEFELLPSVGMKLAASAEPDRGGLLDARAFFSTVPFPPGSSAHMNPGFDLLLVRNSPRHVARIEQLLGRFTRLAIEERTRQVEIETKFIEVSQGALNEMGFEWTLGTPGQPVTSDPWTLPGGQKLFTDSLRGGHDAFRSELAPAGRATGFNTYSATRSDPVSGGLIDHAGELLIRKVNGPLHVDLLIRALERTAGSDLLSAPRILTRSGETASIHIGEVRWFPSAYDVVIERYAQPSLVPVDYQEERTGVLLEVTPELDPEIGTIHLTLAPEIRELAGFDEQHVATIWPEFGGENLTIYRDAPSAVGPYSDKIINFLSARENNRTIYADRLIARRPVFRTRTLSTHVTIENGGTLAMGGLIKEEVESFKDRVPILGRLPLAGRLFRSEGVRNVKRNLLIFVTAHQVDAAGYRIPSH